MTRICRLRDSRSESGLALVEFALLMPFFAVLVFGAVDFGRAYMLYNQLKNASREAANYAQLHPLEQAANGGCTSGSANCCTDPDNATYHGNAEAGRNDLTFTFSPSVASGCDPYGTYASLASGQTISVKVQKGLTLFTPIISSIVGQPVTVSATTKVRVQG